MEGDKLAAYLYFIAGLVSVIYAISVYQARARVRRKQALANEHQPPADNNTTPANQQQPHAENNAHTADKQQALPEDNAPPTDQQQPSPDKQDSQSGKKERDLPQHGGSISSSGQPELKP
jgi:hypothetical protein